MHRLVRCKLEHRCWCAHGEDVSFTDVKIKIPDRKFDQEMWMTSCTGGFWKKWVELRTRLRTGRVDFRGSLRPDGFVCDRCHTRWGADGKVIIERLCISLPYVETFNSKVIKGFITELRSRYVFFVFWDSYVLYICICYEHSMYAYVTPVEYFKHPKGVIIYLFFVGLEIFVSRFYVLIII